MRLRHVGGDIVDVAPHVAEAAVLWLRSGFNVRFSTWYSRLREAGLASMTPGVALDRPWLSPIDSVWRLETPLGQLRYLYVFSNPQDSHGCTDLQQVHVAVERCLDRLRELDVRRVAMIHIPACAQDAVPSRDDGLASAGVMIESLRAWSRRNPESIQEVVLVDLKDDFAAVLGEDDPTDAPRRG